MSSELKRVCELLICAVIVVTSAASGAETIDIQLKKNAYIESGKVYVRDIATIDAADETVKRKILEIYVMQAPRIGYVERLSVKDMQVLLAKRNQFDTKKLDVMKFELSGADEVVIHAKGIKYPYAEIIKKAESKLFFELNAENRIVMLEAVKSETNINLPYGKLKFVARLNTGQLTSRMCVWVDVFRNEDSKNGQANMYQANMSQARDDGFYRSVPVWFNVEAYESVYVAKVDIQKKQVISKADFVTQQRNVAEESGMHLEKEAFNQELLLTQMMQAGDVLRKDTIKPVPAVIGGEVVDALVTEGRVSIQVKAIARKDAEIGEVINVKSLQGGGFLKTKVIGKRLVEVI